MGGFLLRGAGDAARDEGRVLAAQAESRLKEIRSTTELKAGNRADPTRTRLAVGQILRLYQEKGYDLASVTLLEGGNVGDTKIVIEIFEGPKVKVHSISFAGNHFASAAQLKTKIGTAASRSWASLASIAATCSTKTARSSSITTIRRAFSRSR